MSESKLFVEILGTVRQGAFSPLVPSVGVWFGPGPFLIGSGPMDGEAMLLLNHGTVSRRHAKVCPEGDGWKVEDLYSDNGIVSFPATMDFASPVAVASRTGCSLPVAFASYDGKPVSEVSIKGPQTLAIGAVVIRLTVAGKEEPDAPLVSGKH